MPSFCAATTRRLDALYSDLLIGVTSFFRNPDAFDALGRKVFPKILEGRGDEPLRAWVLGCSTGQEAYSIAMAFIEASEKASRLRKMQIFATDLNNALLDKARQGLYERMLVQDIAPERLRRFFVEEDGGYRVNKALRELVVFARQNFITDPPFSRMDLISCRNLLIYLEPDLQRKAISAFHFALKPGGFLFLGASESIGAAGRLFEVKDKKHKIYVKKSGRPAIQPPERTSRRESAVAERNTPFPLAPSKQDLPEALRGEQSAQREADRVTVNQFAPPSVLVGSDLQILQFRGSTSAYLEPPKGRATFDVLKMAHEELMLPLRAAINKAKKDNRTTRRENVRFNRNGEIRAVDIEVIPLKNLRDPCFLILFEEAQRAPTANAAARSAPRERRDINDKEGRNAKATLRRTSELEVELAETRDYLQSVQDEHEVANEELQASYEEVQSANEELQSINEELETSKEELESTNEELTTVNEEMAHRNAELGRANSDLMNLQSSTRMPIVLLGRDLSIRRFTAQAEKPFNLRAGDLGRPVGHIGHNLVFVQSNVEMKTGRRNRSKSVQPDEASHNQLDRLVAEVIDTVSEREREVRDHDGRWYLLRARPYLTIDNKLDGAVLVLVDIDAQKRFALAAAEAGNYAEAIVGTIRDPLLILDADLRVHSANPAFYATFKIPTEDAAGRLIYELGNGQWNIPRLRELLEDILPGHTTFNDFEVTHEFEGIGRRTMLLNARALRDISGQPARILLGIEDVTEKLRVQEVMQSRWQSQLSELTTHLQSKIEAERTRIAQDIHDELGAALTGIRMELALPEALPSTITENRRQRKRGGHPSHRRRHRGDASNLHRPPSEPPRQHGTMRGHRMACPGRARADGHPVRAVVERPAGRARSRQGDRALPDRAGGDHQRPSACPGVRAAHPPALGPRRDPDLRQRRRARHYAKCIGLTTVIRHRRHAGARQSIWG
jgi:two-component system CheB/CheR fusion protein